MDGCINHRLVFWLLFLLSYVTLYVTLTWIWMAYVPKLQLRNDVPIMSFSMTHKWQMGKFFLFTIGCQTFALYLTFEDLLFIQNGDKTDMKLNSYTDTISQYCFKDFHTSKKVLICIYWNWNSVLSLEMVFCYKIVLTYCEKKLF